MRKRRCGSSTTTRPSWRYQPWLKGLQLNATELTHPDTSRISGSTRRRPRQVSRARATLHAISHPDVSGMRRRVRIGSHACSPSSSAVCCRPYRPCSRLRLLIFVLFSVIPGSIRLEHERRRPRCMDAQVMERMKKELGLDDPVHVRFGTYIGSSRTLDLGTSFRTREPVTVACSPSACGRRCS